MIVGMEASQYNSSTEQLTLGFNVKRRYVVLSALSASRI